MQQENNKISAVPLMSMKEVTAYLGVGRQAIYRYIKRGILKKYQVAPRHPVKFRKSDVDRALRAGCIRVKD